MRIEAPNVRWPDARLVDDKHGSAVPVTDLGPPRICLFLPDLGGGGAERMMVNLANGFADRGVNVDVVLAAMRGPYCTEVSPKVRLIDLESRRTATSIGGLVGYLRSSRPSVVLSTLKHANIVALVAKRMARVDTPVFIREANTISRERTVTLRDRLVRAMVPRIYAWADGIIAVSEGVAEDIHRCTGISRSKIHTIYNPVVTPDMSRLMQEEVDHPWFVADATDPVILGVGRLDTQKDFPTLIRAFACVRRSVNAKLLILGEGPERAQLLELASSLGVVNHVSLPGFVSNPFAFMARSAVFALSSAWEGLPGALIQAMACGCTVVSTDCPSGPSEILDRGRYGTLVPVGDVRRMAAALLEALRSPRDPDALRRRAGTFSRDRICEEYLKTLLGTAPVEGCAH